MERKEKAEGVFHTGKYKICVYAIAKNEEKFVERWMDAVSEADLVVVADTGSTDATVEKLRARGAQVYEEEIVPWRFDAARNAAMDHIPTDMDLCVSNDLDEIFEPGWREKLEEVWLPQYTRASYLFTWSFKSDGTPDKQFTMEKIHRRQNFRWVHPVHEVLEYSGTNPDRTVRVPGMVLNHHPDPDKPRSQYLPLLELSAQENPEDDRVAFWLGREYLYYDRFDDCIRTLTQYLKMPSARWDEERCAAMRFLSSCYEKKGNPASAAAWLYRAVAECPGVREPYLAMVRFGYSHEDWPLVYMMVTEGLKVTEKSGSYLMETSCWGSDLYDYGAIACHRLGLYRQALGFAEEALAKNPEDTRLKRNVELIRAMLAPDGESE